MEAKGKGGDKKKVKANKRKSQRRRIETENNQLWMEKRSYSSC